MSFGGMLATALAGGANVIGKQAGDDLEQQRKNELMQQASAVEEARQARLLDMQNRLQKERMLYENSGKVADAKLNLAKRSGEQTNELEIAKARGMIQVAIDQAKAVEGAKREATTAAGSDTAYIKALKAISEASAAPDRTDYEGRKLDNAIKQMTVDNAKRITELKTEFGKAAPERQKQISEELSVLTGKDTDKFLPVPLKNEMGAITGYKVFDTKRGAWVDGGGGGGGSIIDQARAAVAAGADINKVNERLKAAGHPPLSSASSAGPSKSGMLPSVSDTAKSEPVYKPASDGSGRMVDVTTGRTLTPEQSRILQKIERGEPTSPHERALLNN